MFRYRKSYNAYKSIEKSDSCPFCRVVDKDLIRLETDLAYVMVNEFKYDLWEFRDVVEHLMVIPKRHVAGMGELSDEEQLAVMKMIASYEADNYNVYARGVASVQRSVPMHQHTHLIKTVNKQSRGGIFLRKPYYLKKM